MSVQTLEAPAAVAAEAPPNPFPGLRPFDFDESHLFFGRDDQSEKLLVSLSRVRFVAVVGTSGSGKSSLVRAGLLPALCSGLIRDAGSEWRVAVMRPARAPLHSLACALTEAGVFDSGSSDDKDIRTALTEAVLRRGSLGLVEAVRQAKMPEDENLLVVVDQFEELFRVAQFATDSDFEDEAAAFVKLLLAAKEQKDLPIYVVITMRSDYLGECAQFWGLPEAINEGQYLIPRMTRNELRDAITGPVAAVGGAGITPHLVNQLVNETQDKPNQLPILQHALMRTWDWAHERSPKGQQLDNEHYEKIGGMDEALSQHADEAYEELDERGRQIAEKLFKCLTEKGPENQEVRRPAPLREICAVAKATEEEVVKVVDAFRAKGRSFLMPPEGAELSADTMIDISHESLISGWGRLHQWVEEEAQSARVYRRLGEQAELHREGQAGLLDEVDVRLAVEWRERWRPDGAWAKRYRYDFSNAMRFLTDCERKVRKEINRLRITTGVFGILFLLAVVSLLLALRSISLQEFYKYKSYHHLTSSALDEGGKGNFPKANSLLGSINLKEWEDIPHFEWKYLWRSSHNEMATLAQQPYAIPSVFFTAQGSKLAAADTGGNVIWWDISNGQAQQPKTVRLKEEAKGENGSQGHMAPIYTAAFSPDGRHVVTGHDDGSLRVWDEGGKKVYDLSRFPEPPKDAGPSGPQAQHEPRGVSSIAFSQDGAVLAAGHADGVVQVWDLASRKPSWYMEPCPQKAEAYCRAGGKAERQSAAGLQSARTAVGFSPDGKYIATGHARGLLLLWDSSNGQIVRTVDSPKGQLDDASSGALRDIFSVTFSPDGEWLAAGRNNGIVDLWYVARQSAPEPDGTPGAGSTPAPRRRRLGGRLATITQEKRANARDAGDANESRETDLGRGAENSHSSSVSTIVFLNKNTVASGSLDGTVKLWDLTKDAGREFVASKKGHSGGILSLAYSPETKRLATGGDDKAVKLWDATEQEPPPSLPEVNSVQSVALSAKSGKLLATVDPGGNIALWDTEERRKLDSPKFEGAQPVGEIRIMSVALSPDGSLLAAGWYDGTVKVWGVGTGQLLQQLDRPPADQIGSNVVALAFISEDGAALAAVNSAGRMKVWDTGTWRLVRDGSFDESHGPAAREYAAAFSPDGTTLAFGVKGENSDVKLLDVGTFKLKSKLKGSGGVKAYLSLAFSGDGRRLVGSLDQTLKVWPTSVTRTEAVINWLPNVLTQRLGIESQREPLILKIYKSPILSVAFNDRVLAVAPASGGIELLRAAENDRIERQQLSENQQPAQTN
ncbi:MAG TPA: WD40 repeat domain-containing protein [Pyrinomonadaceae bacterium]|nr:WD40 repeat domain-containing protein [Pyrinomonadaceae bacterium]